MHAAADTYRTAVTTLDRLEQDIAAIRARIAEVRADRTRTEAYKDEYVAELEAELHELVRTTRDRLTSTLASAENKAAVELRGDPTDAALEARKMRAASRVARLLDGGRSPVEAGQVFAASGDLDALRALRDEIPAYVATVHGTASATHRARMTADVLLAVDRLAQPLLPPDEARAVDVGMGVDAARDRLERLVQHAVAPSTSSSIALALASQLPASA